MLVHKRDWSLNNYFIEKPVVTSYWFDNLGFITEGNTYLRYATSSLPLWGNTDVVLADRSFSGAIVRERSKGISGAVATEDLQHIPGS